ncbi:hypothetical protein MASR2M78_27630 [Treponema sp.]
MLSQLNDRERAILSRLSDQGSVSVSALAVELGLSEVTIRSHLKELEDKGWLNRTRGGAAACHAPRYIGAPTRAAGRKKCHRPRRC